MSETTKPAVIRAQDIKSAVLRRLVEEVRIEKAQPSTKYNRIHNRHNRGR